MSDQGRPPGRPPSRCNGVSPASSARPDAAAAAPHGASHIQNSTVSHALVVTKSRPLGQGSGPARPAECTARPSAHAVRMVSETTAEVAHSRPGDGSTVATSRLYPRLQPTPRLGGKMRLLGQFTVGQRPTDDVYRRTCSVRGRHRHGSAHRRVKRRSMGRVVAHECSGADRARGRGVRIPAGRKKAGNRYGC